MSGRVAQVWLGQLEVGQLVEDDTGLIEFRISDRYRHLARRPVLGQWFEDHPQRNQRSNRPGDLPPFFANIVPEGDLRLRLEERLGVAPGDDLGFLCAVGRDLPGALVVDQQQGESPAREATRTQELATEPGLRFSLAGVQMKFSMIRRGERFAMPGIDDRGEWIGKVAFDSYPDLCVNEWVTMEWARRVGFDVPVTELRKLGDLIGIPHEADPSTPVFVIQRYDRGPNGTRIHQEDFQQVVGRTPESKYDNVTYEGLTLLATRIVGGNAYQEMIKRLAFVVASGNNDAHMKNWSIIYPDGITARLSPLYDQVFTAQWPTFSVRLALKLGGTKEFSSIDVARFRELARRLSQNPDDTERIVARTIAEAATAWGQIRDNLAVSKEYREAIRRHWGRVPLLQPHALLM